MQDYNVGQMMAQIKDKGQDYGRYVAIPEGVNWWVRETKGFSLRRRPPVLLLHGAPSSSWSYVKTMKQVQFRIWFDLLKFLAFLLVVCFEVMFFAPCLVQNTYWHLHSHVVLRVGGPDLHKRAWFILSRLVVELR